MLLVQQLRRPLVCSRPRLLSQNVGVDLHVELVVICDEPYQAVNYMGMG